MMCPHCGHEINPGVNGAADPTPIYVNLGNNGCNPIPVANWIQVPNIAGTNPVPMPLGWQTTNIAAGCNPVMTTFIKV